MSASGVGCRSLDLAGDVSVSSSVLGSRQGVQVPGNTVLTAADGPFSVTLPAAPSRCWPGVSAGPCHSRSYVPSALASTQSSSDISALRSASSSSGPLSSLDKVVSELTASPSNVAVLPGWADGLDAAGYVPMRETARNLPPLPRYPGEPPRVAERGKWHDALSICCPDV